MMTEDYATVDALRSSCGFIQIAGDRLHAGNERFRRTWRIAADGALHAESFHDLAEGMEWLVAPPNPPKAHAAARPNWSLRALPRTSPVATESLEGELTVFAGVLTRRYQLQIFPNCRGVRMRQQGDGPATIAVRSPDDVPASSDAATGVEQEPASMSLSAASPDVSGSESGNEGVLDALTLAPLHLRLTQVTFYDRTDQHNELVFEREWLLHTAERPLTLEGCLFYAEDVLTGSGLIFLKESPLPYARPLPTPRDLSVKPAERQFAFLGQSGGETGAGYAHVTLAYTGGTAGRIAAMQRYQRCLRPYVAGRDGLFIANTWGDRNRDGRIRAEFIEKEIEAGARLGVDMIQIDDGWQVGATSNSVRAQVAGGVWEGFYAAEEEFWSVNAERFPDGLAPLVADARKRGMRFGLWFAPDSSNDFANYPRDADTIIRLHQQLDIAAVKIDGVKVRSQAGERNLRAFFDRVLTQTAGQIVFDLDITAEIRPGYFGMIDVGPLFVENRYTDWRRYWPHQTLRNFWKLAHHIDPLRLRMEWLNHARNEDKYASDPLAPLAYRPDYLFATVLLASPLGWFELSSLPESYFAHAAPLIAVWKRHRDRLAASVILPVGDAPDGTSWTGFAALTADGEGAYLLLFRERNRRARWLAHLPFLPDTPDIQQAITLFGEGSLSLHPGGMLTATIDEPQRYLFAYLKFPVCGDVSSG